MAQKRSWQSLTPAYRARLLRGGITEATYGTVPATKARGHARTPERPSRATAVRYPEYLSKRGTKPKTVSRRVFDRIFDRIDPGNRLSRNDYWDAMTPQVRRQWVDWQETAHAAYLNRDTEDTPAYITASWEIMVDVEHPEWDSMLFWYH